MFWFQLHLSLAEKPGYERGFNGLMKNNPGDLHSALFVETDDAQLPTGKGDTPCP
jgi:hypothetical protein